MTSSIVIGIAVLVLLVLRQLRPRPAKEGTRWVLLLVLAGYGVTQVSAAAKGHTLKTETIALIVASLIVAAVFGAIRAATVRLWVEGSTVMQRGSAVTVALWIVAIAVHLGLDVLIDKSTDISHLGTSTLLIYLAVTFGVQSLIIAGRAAKVRTTTGVAPARAF